MEIPEEFGELNRSDSRGTVSSPTLRVIIAPQRREEVIDPVRLSSEEFKRLLMANGHKSGVDILSFDYGKTSRIEGNRLIIEEAAGSRGYMGTPLVRLAFTEGGVLIAELTLAQRGLSLENDHYAGMIVAVEEIDGAIRSVMAFCAEVFDTIDPFQRHGVYYLNVALLDLGYRTLAPKQRAPKSVTMRMSGRESIVAYDVPRKISRDDLRSSQSEVDRVLALLTRKAAE